MHRFKEVEDQVLSLNEIEDSKNPKKTFKKKFGSILERAGQFYGKNAN